MNHAGKKHKTAVTVVTIALEMWDGVGLTDYDNINLPRRFFSLYKTKVKELSACISILFENLSFSCYHIRAFENALGATKKNYCIATEDKKGNRNAILVLRAFKNRKPQEDRL